MPFTDPQEQAFSELYRKAVAMDQDAKLVQLTDTMIALLLEAGEASIKHLHCKTVIPHHMNRGGAMMQYLLVMLIPMQFMSTNLNPNELCHKNHMVPARCAEWINDHCACQDAHLVA